MKLFLRIVIYFITFSTLFSFQKEENITNDNLTILNKLTEQIIEQAINNIDLKNCERVYIKIIESNDQLDWYIKNWITNLFNKRNFNSISIYRNNDSLKMNSAIVLEFKIIRLGVKYTGKYNFWKTTSVERQLFSELWLNIYNLSDGLIYWAGDAKRNYSDKIRMDQITALENPNLLFTQAMLPSPAPFKTLIEPIFIMGITGAIVYLFYSFRSK